MATSVKTDNSEHYVEFDEYIDYQLQKTRSHIKWTDILTAIAGVGTMALGYLLLFVVLDHWVVEGGFSRISRGLMLGGLVLTAVAWLAWSVVVPYWKQVNRLFAARSIERSDPSFKNTLLNLVDIQNS